MKKKEERNFEGIVISQQLHIIKLYEKLWRLEDDHKRLEDDHKRLEDAHKKLQKKVKNDEKRNVV